MQVLNRFMGLFGGPRQTPTVEYWKEPERCGWLMKQGAVIKTWRKRWFVLKQNRIFWFLGPEVSKDTVPRGEIDVGRCLSIKGAEEQLNKPFAFELTTHEETMYFVAMSDKEKEDWINAVGRAIVRQSSSLVDE